MKTEPQIAIERCQRLIKIKLSKPSNTSRYNLRQELEEILSLLEIAQRQ